MYVYLIDNLTIHPTQAGAFIRAGELAQRMGMRPIYLEDVDIAPEDNGPVVMISTHLPKQGD